MSFTSSFKDKTHNWISIANGDKCCEGDDVCAVVYGDSVIGTLVSIKDDTLVIEQERGMRTEPNIDDISELILLYDKKEDNTKPGKTRSEILEQAKICVCGHRENEYGSPEDNFKTIAELWGAYKDVEFTATDVAMMMALLKIARVKGGNATEDSFVDLAGYAACGGEISTNLEKEKH